MHRCRWGRVRRPTGCNPASPVTATGLPKGLPVSSRAFRSYRHGGRPVERRGNRYKGRPRRATASGSGPLQAGRAILGDGQLADWEAIGDDPPHAELTVLTACRVWRLAEEGRHCSKTAAGEWALRRDPMLTVVRDALARRVAIPPGALDRAQGAQLLVLVRARLAQAGDSGCLTGQWRERGAAAVSPWVATRSGLVSAPAGLAGR